MGCPCNNINNSGFIAPIGSRSPKYYFINDYSTLDSNTILASDTEAGSIFHKMLIDLGIGSDEYRLFNAVACRTDRIDETNIADCKSIILADIDKSSPSVIILLGKMPLYIFKPNFKGNLNQARQLFKNFTYKGIPVVIGCSPKYVARRGMEIYESDFVLPIKNGIDKANGIVVSSNDIQFETIRPSEISRLFDELSEQEIATDIEADSLDTLSVDYTVCGIGVSSREKNFYIVIKSFEHDYTDEWAEYKHLLADFFKKKDRIFVFNLSYEYKAFINVLNGTFPFWDVYQDCKQVNIFSGLKEVVPVKLGIPGWGDIVWDIADTFVKVIKSLHSDRGESKTHTELKELGFIEFLKKEHKKPTKKLLELKSDLQYILNVYDESYYDKVIEFISYSVENKLFNPPMSFIPESIIAEYCVRDTSIPFQLFDKLRSDMCDKEIELASPMYQNHAVHGVNLEINGIHFDDEYATKLKTEYTGKLLIHLRNIILNPLWVKVHRENLVVYRFVSDKGIIRWSLSEDKKKRGNESVKKYVVEDFPFLNEIEPFLLLFNPESTHEDTREKFLKALDTSNFTVARLVRQYLKELDANDANGDDEWGQLVYYNTPLFSKLLKQNPDKVDRFNAFKSMINTEGIDDILTSTEYQIAGKILSNNFESLDLPNITEMYFVLTDGMGVDINNKATWTVEMQLLYDFKCFKKIHKAISTYIEGKIGRGSVWIVDAEELQTGVFAKRKRPYGNKVDTESYILDTRFNVNGATTKRWKAALHTLPPNCDLRDIQTSRYPDGLIAHVDYAQQEIRVLGGVSFDEVMIEAFNTGMDIHKVIASKIFNKPVEEVTSAERKHAKACSFALIYGKTVQGVADDFFKGDLSKATQLFSMFYGKFPNVKRYFDNKEFELKTNGHVTTMFGDKILIDYNESMSKGMKNQAIRWSKNYPIQSAGSMLAGEGMERFRRVCPPDIKQTCFTHDSTDIDFRVKRLMLMLDLLREHMVDSIRKDYNIPVDIDIELGVSGNRLIKVEIEQLEDNLFVTYKGKVEDVDAVIERLETTYIVSDRKVKESEDEYVSLGELFEKKGAYSSLFGTTITKEKGSFIMRLKDE